MNVESSSTYQSISLKQNTPINEEYICATISYEESEYNGNTYHSVKFSKISTKTIKKYKLQEIYEIL